MGFVSLVVALAFALPAAPAGADGSASHDRCHGSWSGWSRSCIEVRFSWMHGFDDPATPDNLDRVGVLKIGSDWARNVLVLNPGTSAGAGYFKPLAKDIVRATGGRWQVWSVERRENQLEDHSMLAMAKLRAATPQQLFEYYLGWLSNPSITNHFQLIPDADVSFALGNERRDRGSPLSAEAAEHHGRHVSGGHCLGGSITTAYATGTLAPRARTTRRPRLHDGGATRRR
jgi:hypothetical protein